MIRLFGYVAIVAGLSVVAVWFASDPGTIVLIWRGWRLDTSVGLALPGINAAAGLAFALIWSVGAAHDEVPEALTLSPTVLRQSMAGSQFAPAN